MNDYLTIKFAIGLGDLKFGASRDDVELYLGDEYEIDDYEIDEYEDSIMWLYRRTGISLSFDAEENYVLVTLETDNHESLVWGRKVFKMSKED